MLRVNYLPPEQMPAHQRDFPRQGQRVDMPTAEGSRGLGLMVLGYLVAMMGGIILLGQLTAPASRSSATSITVGVSK